MISKWWTGFEEEEDYWVVKESHKVQIDQFCSLLLYCTQTNTTFKPTSLSLIRDKFRYNLAHVLFYQRFSWGHKNQQNIFLLVHNFLPIFSSSYLQKFLCFYFYYSHFISLYIYIFFRFILFKRKEGEIRIKW
jgi:hypothetical protein